MPLETHMQRKIVKLDYLRGLEDKLTDEYSYMRTLFWESSGIIQHIMYDRLQRALSLVSDLSENSVVLDLGTADGPFLPTLSRYFKRIIGVDIDQVSIGFAHEVINFAARRLDNVSPLAADGLNLPFASNSFDIVFCLETFEHVSDIQAVVSEISRILKMNGIFVCSLPIEVGLPLLIRQVAGFILRFPRDNYTLRELIDGVLRRDLESKRNKEKLIHSHRFFDWHLALDKIVHSSFNHQVTVYSPFARNPLISTTSIMRFINHE